MFTGTKANDLRVGSAVYNLFVKSGNQELLDQIKAKFNLENQLLKAVVQ